MRSKKLVRTFVILLIAGASISGVIDNISQDYAEKALTRALATFAVARTLNGVISVAQGTEVAVEPGGVGITMTPGQILDPVNDLIERFSSVMLVAASSLGLQIVLLEISSWIAVTVLLTAALAVWLASTWSERLKNNRYVGLTIRFALVLAFVRFAVPVVIICTNFIFGTFLLTKHETAEAVLQGATTRIENLNVQYDEPTVPDELPPMSEEQSTERSEESVLDYLRSAYESIPDFGEISARIKDSAQDWYSGVAEWFGDMSVSTRMAQLQESAANTTSHIVNLIVIFVLQTIIFPLGFLWIFVEVLKAVAAKSISVMGVQKS